MAKLLERMPLEGYHILQTDDPTVEGVNGRVELEHTGVTLVLDHGFTPAFSRKRLTSSRVALPVTRFGCGP
jgi:hypothetical protein